jgi:hypothetical protein
MRGTVRVALTDPKQSDAVIAEGRHKWLCQDWSCPMRHFCAQHFGLSERYAAMREQRASEALVCPSRRGERCGHFHLAVRDHFAESLGETRVLPNVAEIGRA